MRILILLIFMMPQSYLLGKDSGFLEFLHKAVEKDPNSKGEGREIKAALQNVDSLSSQYYPSLYMDSNVEFAKSLSSDRTDTCRWYQ